MDFFKGLAWGLLFAAFMWVVLYLVIAWAL